MFLKKTCVFDVNKIDVYSEESQDCVDGDNTIYIFSVLLDSSFRRCSFLGEWPILLDASYFSFESRYVDGIRYISSCYVFDDNSVAGEHSNFRLQLEGARR